MHLGLDDPSHQQRDTVNAVGALVFSVVVSQSMSDVSSEAAVCMNHKVVDHGNLVFIKGTTYSDRAGIAKES